MPPLSKCGKQIKSLAKNKQEKNKNKLLVPLDVNNNLDDDNSDNEEVIWGDVELDEKAETFVGVLLNGMKNYVPSVRKSVYIGNSQITNFFNPLSLQSHPPSDPDKPDNQSDNQNSDDQNSECEEYFNYKQLIKSLENEVKSGPYFARCLREWEKLVKNSETIPISKREKHCKIKSLLDDEDVQMQIATYLHENKFEFYVADFVDYVKNVVFPSLGIEQETTISTRTARNWLNKMGFEFKQFKKGVYVDGHERPNVITYRSKFLEQMAR
ncbi:unnamed protein product [Rhizophagus irregularis]|nr:unnamed protein product [Rhizophagus irregularis]